MFHAEYSLMLVNRGNVFGFSYWYPNFRDSIIPANYTVRRPIIVLKKIFDLKIKWFLVSFKLFKRSLYLGVVWYNINIQTQSAPLNILRALRLATTITIQSLLSVDLIAAVLSAWLKYHIHAKYTITIQHWFCADL